VRQFDLRQPEIVDALHKVLEIVKFPGLTEIAVRLKLIALHDICSRIGGGQDTSSAECHRRPRMKTRSFLATVYSVAVAAPATVPAPKRDGPVQVATELRPILRVKRDG
jgi:hypothetical protein